MNLSSILLAVNLWGSALIPNPRESVPPLSHQSDDLVPASWSPHEDESDTLTLCFVGDVLLDRGVRQFVERKASRLQHKDQSKAVNYLFTQQIDQLFRSSQVVIANLECPATEIKAPVYKRFNFRAEPTWLPVLRKHGITHCNLANNHSVDQGRKGLLSTIKHIKASGMKPVGAGATMEEATQPVLLASHPRKVYLIASVQMALENYPLLPERPSVSQMTISQMREKIKTLKRNDPRCVVLVSLHWGAEHTTQPVAQQRMQARQLIEDGADALICHHTHTLQSTERYQGKPIFYSIGNFIFDQPKPINSQAIAVQLHITKKNITTRTIPITIKNCVPQITKSK